jgi:hypothetical protein
MQVGCRRVEACLDFQRAAFTQLAEEFLVAQNLIGTPGKFSHLVRNIGHAIP